MYHTQELRDMIFTSGYTGRIPIRYVQIDERLEHIHTAEKVLLVKMVVTPLFFQPRRVKYGEVILCTLITCSKFST